eukprot:7503380-Pyramimonas_sp.AAC.1
MDHGAPFALLEFRRKFSALDRGELQDAREVGLIGLCSGVSYNVVAFHHRVEHPCLFLLQALVVFPECLQCSRFGRNLLLGEVACDEVASYDVAM